MFNEEYHIQIAVIRWMQMQYPHILFTIAPSGMKLPIGVATKLKRMGYSKGTPDIMIFEPRGEYHGLFIELKTKTGRITPAQLAWIEMLTVRDYYATVCRSFDEAKDTIKKYLKNVDTLD